MAFDVFRDRDPNRGRITLGSTGKSDKFLNRPPVVAGGVLPVPEPALYAHLLSGALLLGLGGLRRRPGPGPA
jgi:hypothetical protein